MNAPTGTDRERLLRLLENRGTTTELSGSPVAPGQENMLTAESTTAGRSHNDLVAVRIDGQLDVSHLRRALHLLAERQEVLRSRFTVPPRSQMLVGPPSDGLDVIASGTEDWEAFVGRTAMELLSTKIDPFVGPLQRLVLVVVRPETHVLLVAVHHLICDAHSHGVYVSELAALYQAEVSGVPAVLPRVRPYRDHAEQQRELLSPTERAGELPTATETALERQVAALRPPLPTMAWPRQPAERRYYQRVVDQTWSAEFVSRVDSVLAGEGLTFGMGLTAAWALALHARYGARDIRIGMPVANRLDPAFDHTIGLFAGMAVLRLRVDDEVSVGEVRTRVRQGLVAVWEDGGLPLGTVVRRLRALHPGLRTTDLFESVVSLAARPDPITTSDEVQFVALDSFDLPPAPAPAFQPLTLTTRREGRAGRGACTVRLGHDTDLVTTTEAAELLADLRAFLEVRA